MSGNTDGIKKIMFHINSLGKGGAERVVVNLSEQFVKMGIETVIATIWRADDEYSHSDTIRRVNLETPGDADMSASALRSERRRRLHKLIKEEKPDCVLSFCRNANYRSISAAIGTGVQVIFSVRSDPKVDYKPKKERLLSRIFYKMAAGGVFQTEEARSFFKGSIAGKSTVILNPLNEAFLNRPKAQVRRNVIASSGRFNEAKDQMLLIHAFENIMADYPDYTLEMYGAPSEDNTFEEISNYVKDHGLGERVLFMGNRNDLYNCLSDVAVYVLPSKYEGMPNALIEAMALSVPVISTDCPCGGPRMLIEDGENGLLVEVENVKEMTAAIRNYLKDPEAAERLAENAGKITERVTPEKIAIEWLDYIKAVCRK